MSMIDDAELDAYLLRNGVTGPLVEKILSLKQMAEYMCEDIEDYILSEYLLQSGRKMYESIWFFSSKYALEAKEILTPNYSIDINYIYKNINYHQILYSNLNPLDRKSTNAESSVKIEFDTDVRNIIQASGENCNNFLSIYQKHILPNTKYDRIEIREPSVETG